MAGGEPRVAPDTGTHGRTPDAGSGHISRNPGHEVRGYGGAYWVFVYKVRGNGACRSVHREKAARVVEGEAGGPGAEEERELPLHEHGDLGEAVYGGVSFQQALPLPGV